MSIATTSSLPKSFAAAPKVDLNSAALETLNGPQLLSVAEGPDDTRAFRALCMLQEMEKTPREVTSVLLRVLEDPSPELRDIAAWYLGRYDKLPERTIKPLVTALQDPDADVRQQAASTLGTDERHVKKVLVPLRQALNDEEGVVVDAASWALKKLGHADATPLPLDYKPPRRPRQDPESEKTRSRFRPLSLAWTVGSYMAWGVATALYHGGRLLFSNRNSQSKSRAGTKKRTSRS